MELRFVDGILAGIVVGLWLSIPHATFVWRYGAVALAHAGRNHQLESQTNLSSPISSIDYRLPGDFPFFRTDWLAALLANTNQVSISRLPICIAMVAS